MSEAERDYETEAVSQGWKEDGPLDAKEFVEKGEKIAGILKSKNDRLEDKVDRQGVEIQGLKESNKQFGEYHKQTLESQRQKDAGRVSQLEEQLAQAVTDGDGQAFQQTRNELESMKPQQQSDTILEESAAAWNQLSQDWASENKWYNENRKLGACADGISDQIRSEGYSGQAYFSEITKRVREDFPEEFENPNQSMPAGVEAGGQLSTLDSKVQTYANLPPDAKAACDNFVKEGFMSKEDYVSQYEFEQGV